MNKKSRLTISIIAAIILLACACPVSSLPAIANEPTSSVSVIPTIEQLPNPAILYSDDFSTKSKELETYSDKSGSVDTKDGVYNVRTITDLWNWGRSSSEFADTVIEIDATLVSGPDNNNVGFGVICRLHSREDNSFDGYLLAISGDGFYSIRSISSSSMSPLIDWTASDSINKGTGTNRLRATCNGSDLSLAVNGVVVATTSTISGGSASGGFALAAVSVETDHPIAEVNFDNLVISKP